MPEILPIIVNDVPRCNHLCPQLESNSQCALMRCHRLTHVEDALSDVCEPAVSRGFAVAKRMAMALGETCKALAADAGFDHPVDEGCCERCDGLLALAEYDALKPQTPKS